MTKKLLLLTTLTTLALGLPAAAITHNILTSYQTHSGSLTGTASVTSDTEQNADVLITGGGTNIVLAVALNVTNACLPPFLAITPCGLDGVAMTSLEAEAGCAIGLGEVVAALTREMRHL